MAAMTRPILEVTARWREDQPDGFAVTVSFETPDLGEHFAKQLLVAFEGLDHNARWSADVAVRHLHDVAAMPETSRDETIRRRAVGIVAWLQERGHLAADEHNGVAWHRIGLAPPAPESQPAEPPPPPPSAPTTEPSLKAAKKAARPRAAVKKKSGGGARKPRKKATRP
jgi:hypothetical protein